MRFLIPFAHRKPKKCRAPDRDAMYLLRMSLKARWLVGSFVALGVSIAAYRCMRSTCSQQSVRVTTKQAESVKPPKDAKRRASAEIAEEIASSPRAILSRAWFDRYPEKATEEFTVQIFFAGGEGFYRRGSMYRTSFEFFDFERRGNQLDMTLLQDKKSKTSGFEVKACDEKPPFDLCLTIKDPLLGPKQLYGFAYEDDDSLVVRIKRESALQMPTGPR
jgi:hypothetical protein